MSNAVPTPPASNASATAVWRSYVSPLALRGLRSRTPHDAGTAALAVPQVEEIDGVVALLDVEGFSAFAERMGARGADGIERLATRINETFATMVEAIERYGGLAHSFPGDSVIAVWPATDRPLDEALQSATRCCLELLEAHRDSELPLKAGLSCGRLRLAHVGGVDGRVQLLLGGAPLDEMGRAEERSSRGRVIVSEAAWALLAPHAVPVMQADGFVEVKGLRSAPPPGAGAAAATGLATATGDDAAAVDVDALRPYVPAALARQLDAGNADWLGEFREVTVVFLQLRPASGVASSIDPVQEAFAEVQRVVFRHGGDVARFAHDDKGLAVLAVFGLPPAPSEHAAARAVHAAVEVERAGARVGFGCRVGVATGRVFCGTLGAPRRREYSVVGSTANLAARLMQSLDGGVLCDAATAAAAASAQRFESAGRLRPKGFPEAIDVFRVGDTEPRLASSPFAALDAAGDLVGRDRDRARMTAWIERVRRGEAAVALLTGEAGVGKTTLLRDAVARARGLGMDVVAAGCDLVESAAAYAAWSRVLGPLLGLDAADSGGRRAAALASALNAAGVDPQLAPLVAPLLGFDVDDSDATRDMPGPTRADNALAVLARLLLHEAALRRERGRPLLVVLEDVHWLDPASWELLALLSRRDDDAAPAMLLTMRSEVEPGWPEWQDALADARAETLALAPLSQAETAELARRVLRATSLAQPLSQTVWERTRGNPFFCEQLVSALSESGIVAVEGGVATLRVRNPEQAETLLPRSVAAVVTSRLDRLPAPVQLTLKTASVIGANFSLLLLLTIHPMHLDEETLRAHLAEATALGLLDSDAGGGGNGRFRHAITRDVSYDLLLASQRRELHREVALQLEGSDSPAAQAALFYHWRESGDEAQALRHVDHAGAEAMREGRYHTVAELYGYALETLSRRGDADLPPASPGSPPREAVWSGHLGRAQVALGLHEVARSHLETCLATLGEQVPAGPVALAVAIAREAARQVFHRIAIDSVTGRQAERSQVLKLAADTYEQLGYVYYAAGQSTRGLHAALRILNLAELSGLAALMAVSYGVMSLTASVVGLGRLGALYDRRAMRLARETDDAATQAYVGWVTGLRAVGEANWNLAAMRVEAAQRLSQAGGDRRQSMNNLQALAWPAWARGDTARMVELAETQLAIARESSNRLWETWALNGHSEALLMLGDWAAVERNCQRSLEVLSEESDRADEIRAIGLLATSQLRTGRTDEAVATARRGLDLLRGLEMTNFSLFEGIAGIGEALAAHAEQAFERSGSVPATARRHLQQAVDALLRFSRTFPVGRPRSHVLRARLAVLDGKKERAVHQFDRALRAADEFTMPREKALALLASARSNAFALDARRRRLDEAIVLLEGGEALRRALELRAELAREIERTSREA